MTIYEYLKMLSGSFDDSELTSQMILKNELLDIFPTIKEASASGRVLCDIDGENIVTKRSFILEDNSKAYVEKTISLNDDISLYCGKLENPEQLLIATIEWLKETQASYLRISKITGESGEDLKPRIDAFEAALEQMKQKKLN